MSGRTVKMKRLIADREQLKAQIDALTHELRGLDRAITVMNGENTKDNTPPAPRQRGKNVKDTVLSLVVNAGLGGINVNDLMDAAKVMGIHLERGTVSSLLSRMKRETVLDMADGKYFVAAPKPLDVHQKAH